MAVKNAWRKTLNEAVKKDESLKGKTCLVELKSLYASPEFLSIPLDKQAKILYLLGKCTMFTGDIEGANQYLKEAAKKQKYGHIKDLQNKLYSVKKERPFKKQKVERLRKKIHEAKIIYYYIEIYRSWVVGQKGTKESITHPRNILIPILNETQDRWSDSFVGVRLCAQYHMALTYRFARTGSLKNNFDKGLEAFEQRVKACKGRNFSPEVYEYLDDCFIWQAVQLHRRKQSKEALSLLQYISETTGYLSIKVRANLQYAFISSFLPVGSIECASESLDSLEEFDLEPTSQLMWLLAKIRCMQALDPFSVDIAQYEEKLDKAWEAAGFITQEMFQKEYQKIKTLS